jgi:amino acid transporter
VLAIAARLRENPAVSRAIRLAPSASIRGAAVPDSAPDRHSTLVRAIGRWSLVALTVNLIIGSGIFGLPSKVFATAGPWSTVAILACAAICALVVLCFAEVGSRFDRTGGPYLYAREAFGPNVGFAIGWLMLLRPMTSFGAIANLLVNYLAVFWPGVDEGPLRLVVLTAITVVFTTIVYCGVRRAAAVSNLFTIGKLVPLIAFVGVGLFFVHPSRLMLGPWPGAPAMTSAILPLIFAFAGFDGMSTTAGEMTAPRRDLPFALFLSLAGVGVLYALIQAVCVGTLPDLAHSERPLAEAAGSFLGPLAARLIATGAIISTLGALFATALTGPRAAFALAEQGQLPRALAATHPRFHTPHLAIVVTAAGMLLVTLTGSFAYAVTINAMIRLICYATTALALIVLRRRASAPPAGYRAPAGDLVASGAFVLCLWVLSRSTLREARELTIAVAAGFLIYAATRMIALNRRPA